MNLIEKYLGEAFKEKSDYWSGSATPAQTKAAKAALKAIIGFMEKVVMEEGYANTDSKQIYEKARSMMKTFEKQKGDDAMFSNNDARWIYKTSIALFKKKKKKK